MIELTIRSKPIIFFSSPEDFSVLGRPSASIRNPLHLEDDWPLCRIIGCKNYDKIMWFFTLRAGGSYTINYLLHRLFQNLEVQILFPVLGVQSFLSV